MDYERAFNAAFGAYAGCLVAPGASWLAPGWTWPVVAAVFAVAAVAGYLTAQRTGLAANLTGVWRNLSLVVFPFVYLPRLVARPSGLSLVEFVAVPATVGLFALLSGLLVVVTGDLYRNRRAIADATVHVEFEARPGPRSRRWQLLGAGFVVFSGVFGGVVMVFGGNANPGTLVTYLAAAMGGLTPLAAKDDEREVAVTDAGVKVQMQVHDWDSFADYDVTDDALVLERPGRLRSSFAFDREDVERLDEVEAALKRYLPRE